MSVSTVCFIGAKEPAIGYEVDWKRNNDVLGAKSQILVDDFACRVISNFRPDHAGKSTSEILKHFSVFPGCIMTELAYDQRAHIDMSCWSIIVHMPLCEEGLMLYIWPQDNTRKKTGKYTRTICSFLALPSHSVHLGVYGHPGNIRLRMLIRQRDNIWTVDKLIDDDVINKNGTKRRDWIIELKMRLKSGVAEYTEKYTDTLRHKCGSVFCNEWTDNVSLK